MLLVKKLNVISDPLCYDQDIKRPRVRECVWRPAMSQDRLERAAEYEGDAFARDLVGEELPRRICVAKKALKLEISLIFKNCPENPWIEA